MQYTKVSKNRIGWIDSLKGVAIIGVVMSHCTCVDFELPARVANIAYFGSRGVQLFFIISAFLLWKGYSDHSIDTLKNGYSFIIRRMVKWIPLYYVALLIYYFTYSTVNANSIFDLISHALFLHGFFPTYCGGIYAPAWYLGTLAIFYFISPILHRVVNSFSRSVIFFIISSVICPQICAFIGGALSKDSPLYSVYCDYVGMYSIFAQAPVLALGIVLYYLAPIIANSKYINQRRGLSLTLFILACLMLYGESGSKSMIFLFNSHTVSAVFIFIAIVSLIISRNYLIDNCVFALFGRYSLPVFLFHIIIRDICDRLISYTSDFAGWIIRLCTVILISLMVSALLEKLKKCIITIISG